MFRKEQYELLHRRSVECEEMSLTVHDVSVKQKFAQLAEDYRAMANRVQQLDDMETRIQGSLRRPHAA